jgi:hypothetical protein
MPPQAQTQIKGLPPGATVEPINNGPTGIQGLPPGATVEPIDAAPVSHPTAADLPGSTPQLRQSVTTDLPSTHPTQFEKDRSVKENPFMGTLKDLGSMAVGLIKSPASINNIPGMIQQAAQVGTDDAMRANEGRSVPYRILSGIAENAGINTRGAEEAANRGDVGGVVAHSVAAPAIASAIPTAIGHAIAKPAAPIPREVAIDNFRKAISPEGTDIPKFEQNLSNQLDTIVSHGKANGVADALQDAHTHADVADVAANHFKQVAAADPYYSKFLQPNQDVETGTSFIPNYRGGKTVPNTSTIGQLSQRLKEINATLSPKYSKPGAASVAAINAADVAPLQAEAAGIRSTLVDALSRKTGIPPEQIEPLRANYGQLADLADTAEHYAAKLRHGQDVSDITPTTLGDLVPKLTKPTGALNSVPVNPRLWNSTPAGKLLRNAYQNYPATAPFVPEPVELAPTPPRPAPPYDPNTPPTIIPIKRTNGVPPTTPTGKPVTVRAQRAQAARGAAEQANVTAPPQSPPAANGVPDIVSQATDASRLARGGGVRVPKQLGAGKEVPQLPERGVPTQLPPSSLPTPIANAVNPRNLPISDQAKAAFEVAVRSKQPVTGGGDPILRNVMGQDVNAGPNPNLEPRINIVHPSGQSGTIPISQLRDALQEGYRLQHGLDGTAA